jgi:hypothetical protein
MAADLSKFWDWNLRPIVGELSVGIMMASVMARAASVADDSATRRKLRCL